MTDTRSPDDKLETPAPTKGDVREPAVREPVDRSDLPAGGLKTDKGGRPVTDKGGRPVRKDQ